MKKILISIAVIGIMGLFACQHADAGRGWGMNPGPGCPNWDGGYSRLQNVAPQKDIDAFLLATADLRKNLAMKQAEYQAIMNAAAPDPAKAAAVTGEIFQLRNQIRAKAVESGLNVGPGRGGYPCPDGWGNGYGPGGGRGPCRGYMY